MGIQFLKIPFREYAVRGFLDGREGASQKAMKYIVILGDGMADLPSEELGGRTPLEVAKHPQMDDLACHGICGLVKTVPEGMPPGSDTANLSAFGYDPKVYYTGRSPLEAVSMGIDLALTDVTYRCNTVTLSDEAEYEDCTMIDYSCDEISTPESTEIIQDLNKVFETEDLRLYPGISYRHCLVLKNARDGAVCTPPHDILEQGVRGHLPHGQNGDRLLEMMKKSRELLKDHPVNLRRIEKGLRPVSSLWFWGEGRKPNLASFTEKYGKKGAVVSAVDLIKGIGICAGLESIEVEGATGNIDTNFDGKAQAAIRTLLDEGNDFVYVHLEAPDECGHRHETENKVRAIELIDEKIIAPIRKAMEDAGEEYCMMVLPDHPTPLKLRTHTSDPVPFALYRSNTERCSGVDRYTEATAESTGVYVEEGFRLMDWLIRGDD